jgi:hypothetical protein
MDGCSTNIFQSIATGTCFARLNVNRRDGWYKPVPLIQRSKETLLYRKMHQAFVLTEKSFEKKKYWYLNELQVISDLKATIA